MNYVYKRKYLRFLISRFDQIGYGLRSILRFLGLRSRDDNPFNSSSLKKILVIRLDQIGDIVCSEPFLSQLKHHRPNAEITLITMPFGKALLEPVRCVDRFICVNGYWELFRSLRKTKSDLIIDLRGDIRHILLAKLAQPKTFLLSRGFTGGGFLVDIDVPLQENMHAINNNLAFLKYFGIQSVPPKFSTSVAASALTLDFPEKKGAWVALHKGAGTSAKQWKPEYWEQVEQYLKNFSSQPMVFEIGEGKLPLSQLGTFLKKCDLLITTDSGPAHVAATQQTPTIVLFSGTNRLSEWAPLNPNAIVLNHSVSCSPCRKRICDRPTHECMEFITPKEVCEAAHHILVKHDHSVC